MYCQVSPAPAATCGAVAVGGVVRLATTSDLFVCAADALLHWVGDTSALHQAQQTTAIDWASEIALNAPLVDTLPRGDPWLSGGFIKAGDSIGVPKWELNADAQVFGLKCLADAELVGLTAANYGLVYDPDAWARKFNHPGGVTGDGSNIAFGLPAAGAT